ncbi:FAD-binding and (Fe-S)-binding domain-containing protein [Thiomicrorhabdus sediminis]|uniref:FAD-binding oxidoreductase n=1 Tax=Thiomicrorhabdus sediminis TaxID=2580412 RepID=A0A4P9K6R0_9GAMM|nr:FAD-binding and (Fe-S)-binding domain-containing protein [Thiomicrorhabdus sediminis]QCU90699.1 FAD-binding oxidoreductase [Thiomicrorhabdus sediminis]
MSLVTDASIFELEAQQVVYPESSSEFVELVRKCFKAQQRISMRAGGTSLGGQAIGSGVVIDVSQHLTNIISYRPNEQEIDVEPGVIQDDLNDFAKGDNLKFAPDTSTSNRAMIGGMIGNNSCGSYSFYYGTTREHVKSVEVILADGSETTFGPLSEAMLREKLAHQDFEGNIYRTVFNLLERHGKTILENYPHPSIKRRNTGYALDELYRHHQPFNPQGKPFNLAPLICGSEGTLAVIKLATLKLVERPKQQQLICAHFDSIETAMRQVPRLLDFEPAAIELIDKATLEGTKNNLQQQKNRFWINEDPAAVLVIELFDESRELLAQRLKSIQQWLLEQEAYAAPIIDPEDAGKVWQVRKAGLGLLMGKVTRKKAVAVIEDAAVPVHSMYDYFKDIQALMAELKVNCVYYGHASVGLIHIRPELDLATTEGRQLMQTIAERNSKLVKKYRGALSGEHGDGRIRAPFLKEQVGEQVYAWLKELKYAFDPHNLLNPGVIIGDMPITQNLRADRQPIKQLNTGFDWQADISLMDAVEKCNGAAACRKSAGRGVMCPSYQATREENYSTRGRSNLLRFALTEANPAAALSGGELQDALDMCLGCKACKSECPASVDMARLKSEVLYQNHQRRWLPRFKDIAYQNYHYWLSFGQKLPYVFNGLQSLPLVKRLIGVAKQRSLPQASTENLKQWWQGVEASAFLEQDVILNKKVWLLVDVYAQFQEPKAAKATLLSLLKMGFDVNPVWLSKSPRLLISQGLLKQANQALLEVIKQFDGWQADDEIIGIEPSELLVWRDEAKALLNSERLPSQQLEPELARALFATKSFEELALVYQDDIAWPSLTKKVWLHVHCHQKSLASPLDSKKALQLLNGCQVEMIPSGCCGMSGDFGYKHYDVSVKIAEQSLLPSLRQSKAEDLIVATGTSCRHQIKDLGGYQGLHMAQVFAQAWQLEV